MTCSVNHHWLKTVWFTLIVFAVLVGFTYFYTRGFQSTCSLYTFWIDDWQHYGCECFFCHHSGTESYGECSQKRTRWIHSLVKMHWTALCITTTLRCRYCLWWSATTSTTFGYEQPWLMLAIISLGTAGVKHYLNLREKGQLSVWVLPVSVVILLAGAFISCTAKRSGACNSKNWIQRSECHHTGALCKLSFIQTNRWCVQSNHRMA